MKKTRIFFNTITKLLKKEQLPSMEYTKHYKEQEKPSFLPEVLFPETTRDNTLESNYSVLKKYFVGAAEINIVRKDNGSIEYWVNEPSISKKTREILYEILVDLLYFDHVDDDVLLKVIKKKNLDHDIHEHLGELRYAVNRALSGYGRIYPIMKDPLVEEISVEGPNEAVSVFHRDVGLGWITTNIVLSEEELNTLVLNLARKSGRHLSRLSPIAEGITRDGHRIAVTYLNEVSPKGSSFVIRKFLPKPLTILDLIRSETLSTLMAAYLWVLIENFAFLFIIGGMASGKSVASYSELYVKYGKEEARIKFSELWNALSKMGLPSLKLGSFEALYIPKSTELKVLSIGTGKSKIKWVKPRFIFRHAIKEPMVRVLLGNNKFIDVTRDHSLLVLDKEGAITVSKPEKELIGKRVPVLDCKDPLHVAQCGLDYKKVVWLEEENYQNYVYDIEIPQTNIFEANSIFVHNTTLLQSILSLIPSFYRIVTIEDTPELVLPNKRWDRLVTRYEFLAFNRVSKRDIDIETIAKFALRRRAEYVVIGEVRGREARILAQAAATGQGSACTFHADSVYSAIIRLMSKPISLKPAFLQLIWSIIHMQKIKTNMRLERKVIEITEIKPLTNSFKTINVFKWDPVNEAFVPNDIEELIKHSYRLNQLALLKGWTKSSLREEIEIRKNFLEELLNKKRVKDYAEFLESLNHFYQQRYLIG